MDEIVAEAGMSSSTVYRYFPEGKRSLVRAVIVRAMDPVVEWITALADLDELPSPAFSCPFRSGRRRPRIF